MTMTRAQHLAWCKERALGYVKAGDLNSALASMASDLNKHPATEGHAGIGLGIQLRLIGDLSTRESMTRFIEGFN